MVVVVPDEELAADRAGVLDRVEPGGEPGPGGTAGYRSEAA